MPEKDFEKQVQEKMGELKLRPGEPVWNKIEKAIRKDKRKRVFFILPLVAGLLLLGYTGYRMFIRSNDKKNVEAIQQLSVEKNNTEQSKETKPEATKETNASNAENNRSATTRKETTTVNPDPGASEKSTHVQRELVGRKPNREKQANHQKENIDLQKSVKPKNQPALEPKVDNNTDQSAEKVNEQAVVNPRPDTIANQSSKGNEQAVVNPRPDTVANQSSKVNEQAVTDAKPDSTGLKSLTPSKPAFQNDPEKPVARPADSLIASKTKVSVNSKPSKGRKHSGWGIYAAVGISDIRSKPLSFSKSNPMSNWSAGPVLGYPQGPVTPPFSPSEITAGRTFSAGFEWHQSISKRSGFSTGLRYAYFSNQILVGSKTTQQLQLNYNSLADRMIDNYYGGSQTRKFTNRYHFLEIPIEYHFRFNAKKKIGFDWNTGLTLDWLVSSNELMYDTSNGGIYIHSNDLFNKTQLGLITGLSIRFRLKNEAAFLVGPQAFLDLSRITKDGFDRNRYLFAGSIQARYVFPGKTKN